MRDLSCLDAGELRAFLLGHLPESAGEKILTHLALCPTCEALAVEWDELSDSLIDSLRDVPGVRALNGSPSSTGADSGAPSAGVVSPSAVSLSVPGYEVLDQLGCGGTSVVYRARQLRPDRLVALKMILFGPQVSSTRQTRFLAEADMTAKLQHPHIVQIHAAGFHDGLPFLALEFMGGGSLAQRLTGVPRPAREAAALVEVLARAAHHAHQRGVIHRDLKPANILFTRDGLPKIADFGLAKDARPDLTATGAVLGTPSYMSPEQATGDSRSVGPATDVYALGAILYELLTGRAPFRGATVLDTLDQVRGQEAVPPVRLQPKTPRDANTICLKCLHKEPHRRYASAEELADDLRRFRAGETIRARATGPWEKTWRWGRRNPGWATVAVLLVLLASGATAFAWWRDRQAGERRLAAERAEAERLRIDGGRRAAEARAEVEQEFKGRQARQGIASNLKLAEELRKRYQFKAAGEALNQAAALATSGAPELRAEIERAQRDLAFVVRLDDIRFRKWVFVAETGGKGGFNWRIAAPEYRRAFADRGLDLTTLPPADAAGMIAASAIRVEVVAAVDDWALWETGPLRQRLLEVAVRADPGAWTDRLRAPELPEDRAALQKLAADADPRRLSPEALVVLAILMERQNLDPVPLLTAARAAHPSRFELAFTLGRYLYGTRRRDRSAIGPYEAARALRPDNHIVWNNMGVLLNALGDREGAVAVLRRAIELDENNPRTHINLGVALFHKGDAQGAIAAFRRAIALDPKDAAAHTNLGAALRPEDLDAAVAAHKRAIELEPNYAMARVNLGTALFDKKDVPGAIAAFERAIELDPQFAVAYTNLGVVLRPKELDRAITLHMKAIQLDPSNAAAYRNLGMALHSKGDSSGAIAAYTQVTELDPRSARAHFDLGNALRPKNVDGAIAAYSKATKLDPKYSQAFCNLGVALLDKNDVPGAIAALERAVELDPGDALALINLGQALRRNDLNRAVAVLMKATELAPESEQAHFILGCALFDKGEFVRAAAALTRTIQIEPKNAAAHTNLSVIYGTQRKFTDAISHARQAINADPKSSTSHAVLGELLLRTGDVTGARVAFVRAAELDKRWVPLLSKLPPVPVAPPPREVNRP